MYFNFMHKFRIWRSECISEHALEVLYNTAELDIWEALGLIPFK
jgi:hypothetical protein